MLGGDHWATATCQELLLEALLEHASDINGEADQTKQGSEDGTGETPVDETCAEIWTLFSRLWSWFEERELHAVWSIPEDLLLLMHQWPSLADYIKADERRWLRLRAIVEATLDRTIVSKHTTSRSNGDT